MQGLRESPSTVQERNRLKELRQLERNITGFSAFDYLILEGGIKRAGFRGRVLTKKDFTVGVQDNSLRGKKDAEVSAAKENVKGLSSLELIFASVVNFIGCPLDVGTDGRKINVFGSRLECLFICIERAVHAPCEFLKIHPQKECAPI